MPEAVDTLAPSAKLRDLDFLVSRVGVPVVICGALIFILWFVLLDFKKDVSWKLERSIRNERAIMQKLGIAVILDGDREK